MGDWRKTQYRIGPKPDPLAEIEDFKYGVGTWLLIALLVACLIGAVVGLFGLL